MHSRLFYVPVYSAQNFVLKVYIVTNSKVFADFRFESPISIDFQSEILALLPPKSANTFAPKACQDFQNGDFGGNNARISL